MRIRSMLLAGLGAMTLAACAKTPPPPPPPLPPPAGSVNGSTAADRDGDGVVDGYYTADGIYHPYAPPPPPPPPPPPMRTGEKG